MSFSRFPLCWKRCSLYATFYFSYFPWNAKLSSCISHWNLFLSRLTTLTREMIQLVLTRLGKPSPYKPVLWIELGQHILINTFFYSFYAACWTWRGETTIRNRCPISNMGGLRWFWSFTIACWSSSCQVSASNYITNIIVDWIMIITPWDTIGVWLLHCMLLISTWFCKWCWVFFFISNILFHLFRK